MTKQGWIWVVGLGLIAIYAGPGFIKGFSKGFNEGYEAAREGHPGLPSWSSPEGLATVKMAIANGPLNNTGNLQDTAIDAVQTVSASRSAVACKATVVLNSNASGPISYSFTPRPDGSYYASVSADQQALQ